MFKNKSLEAAIKNQAALLAEKESDLKSMQQRLYYAEGRLKTYEEMVDILRKQLQEEMLRSRETQNILLTQKAISNDTYLESLSKIYDEDPSEVAVLQEGFSEDGDL